MHGDHDTITKYDENIINFMLEVGFEPTHPEITELESAALDHSAIQASHLTPPI